jgi:signal transduction histidine kinase/phage shock protein PspC (stress-responsive transcriptional regulator)
VTDTEAPTTSRLTQLRSRLVRSPDDRVLTGLAGGIAARLGLPSVYVRAGFIVAAFAGGAGIAAYLVGLAITLDNDDAAPPAPAPPATTQRRVALAAIFVGSLGLLRSLGIWFGEVVWPVAWITFGAAFIWDRTDDERRERITQLARPTSTAPSRGRLVGGVILLFLGLGSLFASVEQFDLGPALFAAVITGLGFLLLFGPWVVRMTNDLAEERRSRIRSEERADMAAHLHDSVLQTLALIQRTDEPKRMVTLARAQERELREWLYGEDRRDGEQHIRGAIEAAAGRVEHDHDVPVDVVVVGDAPLDPGTSALVKAAGEAMTNAAKHSGALKVSVYVEVSDTVVDAWVADQGTGFDPDAIDPQRRGIADSIRGRLLRHGGTAEITSEPDEGTEVHLHIERRPEWAS